VTKENSLAKLHWSTASNKSAASFEIERSQDNSTFIKVGEIKDKAKAKPEVMISLMSLMNLTIYRFFIESK
jgi:hypothetical protein